MAIDSRAKSRSAIHFLMPFYPATGEPGGGIDQADSQESAWSYRGVLALVRIHFLVNMYVDNRQAGVKVDNRQPPISVDNREVTLIR